MRKKKKSLGNGSEEERKKRKEEEDERWKKEKMLLVMSGSDLTTHKIWPHRVFIFTSVPLRISSQFLKTPVSCFLFPSL